MRTAKYIAEKKMNDITVAGKMRRVAAGKMRCVAAGEKRRVVAGR